jgi:hypothetical protein
MYCKQCGKEIFKEAVICVNCGCAVGGGTVSSGTLTAGYICAVVMPIIGVVVAILCLAKGKITHGVAMMALSVAGWCFWAGFLSR